MLPLAKRQQGEADQLAHLVYHLSINLRVTYSSILLA